MTTPPVELTHGPRAMHAWTVGAMLCINSLAAAAQSTDEDRGAFTDPEDGAFDASDWLLDRKGFLPVPIIITEPAIGYGGGAAVLWFSESLRAHGARHERLSPPDIYGAALAATENGTRIAGAFGMVTFGDEYWRWRGGIGRPDINIDFYGAGGELDNGDFKIGYNVEGWLSTQQLMRRLGEGENFVGARWIYFDLDSVFDPSQSPLPLPTNGREVRSSGLGLFFEHDSRDNFFTASRGWKAYAESMFYTPDFGGDREYQTYRAYGFGYLPVGGRLVLGGRADARAARGDVPFYQLPFIDMRGIPISRYQDENVAVVEVELRWNLNARWALLAFAGNGRTWGTSKNFEEGESASAWGAGFRRLVARRLGIYMGIDVAQGPEETAFYIQAGSAWR
jgi:hypothetical protein